MNKLLWIVVLVFMGACSVSQKTGPLNYGANMIRPSEEPGEEYEITIIDPDFDRWFTTNGRPVTFYGPNYYVQKNRMYVSAWNEMVTRQSMYNSWYYPFTQHINYDQSVDYGVEVNYKLFWYFRYIESVYGRRFGFPAS